MYSVYCVYYNSSVYCVYYNSSVYCVYYNSSVYCVYYNTSIFCVYHIFTVYIESKEAELLRALANHKRVLMRMSRSNHLVFADPPIGCVTQLDELCSIHIDTKVLYITIQ